MASNGVPEALFLDRDGTLIRWRHYLREPDEVALLPGIASALRKAKQLGCLLFLHTNQSGVGRGYFGMDAVEAANRRMYELMGLDESFFDGVCIATDAPDEAGPDTYRKPSPRFEREMMEHYRLHPENCYMLGDSLSDLETGRAAGIVPVFIRSDQEVDEARLGDVDCYGSVAEFVDRKFPGT